MYVDPVKEMEWRDRFERLMSAAFVVVCYLVVFAGLLYSVASRAGTP